MVSETENGSRSNGLNKSNEEIFEKKRKMIDSYSIVVLLILISAVLLISLNLKLLAGCLVIAGAGLGVIVVRKASELNKNFKESLNEFSSLNERKDDVIIDFSHRIREPLNNLVIISDMLMESGLQKKQKELLETFIASTNNMVTTVNELSMQTDKSITLINDIGTERSLAARLISSGKGTFSQEIGTNSTILNIHLPFTSQVSEPRLKTASKKMEELIQKDKT